MMCGDREYRTYRAIWATGSILLVYWVYCCQLSDASSICMHTRLAALHTYHRTRTTLDPTCVPFSLCHCSMGAAFGAGVCFSFVSGVPNPLQSALTTGAAFAGFNGLFYQVRKLHRVLKQSIKLLHM